MRDVVLPGSGRSTTQIAYGTSGLHGGWDRRRSLALLETAFEAGIRHFDTAPLYGLGNAEEIVGEFIARHRGKVTITTKFGLSPPRSRALFEMARGLLRPIVARLPRAKARLVRAASQVAAMAAPKVSERYSVPAMRASLAQSLRKLRCERIDVFLLHEADAPDLNEDLRGALDDEVRKGAIGAWGLGSARQRVDRATTTAPKPYSVLQFEWSVASDRLPHYPDSFIITHGALKDAGPWLRAELQRPGRHQAWANELGIDLSDPKSIANLLIGAAAAANPCGVVLFTSKTPAHIRDLAQLDEADVRIGQRFISMLASDR